MQFDHIVGQKESGLAEMAQSTISLKKLIEEAAKCELVCANCHAARTYIRNRSKEGRLARREAILIAKVAHAR